MGILFAGGAQPDSLAGCLSAQFGPVDYESPVLPFAFTDYYQKEMGPVISRRFLSFRMLVSPEELADIKIRTNELEESYILEGGRKVNLDPGLLNLSRFILATTKDNSHRIPLKKGIYAELTLQFARKDFQVLPWTYPDYASREYRDILIQIRDIFKVNLKRQENPSRY
jgi:hypothetical protein